MKHFILLIIWSLIISCFCKDNESDLQQNTSQSVKATLALPSGFVYLSDVAPTILQEIRYAGDHNFIGRPIDGYEKPVCILTEEAANALKRVQDKLLPGKFSLKVYDCYRPTRSVADFIKWSEDNTEPIMKKEFFPYISKSQIRELGYLLDKSGHSRGSTVDLTIVTNPPFTQPTFSRDNPQNPCDSPNRFPDNSIDMGTGFDCFSPAAHTNSPFISSNTNARRNRYALVKVMEAEGFENYSKEWWHFTLKNEPHPDEYFDFPVA